MRALALNSVRPEGCQPLVPAGKLTSLLGPAAAVDDLVEGDSRFGGPDPREVWIEVRRYRGPGQKDLSSFKILPPPWANTLRNVAFGLELRGMPKMKEIRLPKIHHPGGIGRF